MSDKKIENNLKILTLEDNLGDVELIKNELDEAKINFSMRHVYTRNDFLHELEDFVPDVILVDYTIPGFSGIEALNLVKELAPTIPVVFVTGTIDEESAVECMKAGAADYVLKNSLKRISPAIKGGIEKRKVSFEKKQIEEKLIAAVNILENIPDAVFAVNTQGKVMYWNKASKEVFGYSSEEMSNNSLIFFESESRKEEFLLNISSLGDSKDYQSDEKCINKNGEIFWSCIKAKILTDSNDQIVGFVCNASNIEERKNDEQGLTSYKLSSEKIFNCLPDITLIINKENKIIDIRIPSHFDYINPDKINLLGGNVFELSKKYSFISKELISQISYYVLLTLKTEYIQTFEYKFIVYNNLYNFELRFVPADHDEVLVIIKDITGQEHVKVNDNGSSNTEGLIQHSLDGKIINANPEIIKLLGYHSLDEMKNSVQIKDIYYIPESYDKVISGLIINEVIANLETSFQKKDKTETPVKINARMIKDKAKNTILFELLIRNLAENNSDNQIRQIQKLESLSSLITDISYEFNNLISSLSMNIYISEHELPENHPVSENLANMKGSISQASELSAKLLNFNQIIKS